MAEENVHVNRTGLFGSTEHVPCRMLVESKHIEWTQFKGSSRKARLPSK
jgi:hypothetical protein